jgi:hypothetical protein
MLVVQNQWSQKDYGRDSGDVAEETHSVLKNKPSPKPCTKSSQTLKNKKTTKMRKSNRIPFSENWNEQETREEENPENEDQDEGLLIIDFCGTQFALVSKWGRICSCAVNLSFRCVDVDCPGSFVMPTVCWTCVDVR